MSDKQIHDPVVTDVRRELEDFCIRFIGESPGTDLPGAPRAKMQKRLISSMHELIKLIERLPYEVDREHAFNQLWGIAAACYFLGQGVTTVTDAATVKREQGRIAGRAKAIKHSEDPVNQIMKFVVDGRYHDGDEKHAWKMGAGMLDDVNRALVDAGLPPLERHDRIARYLESKKPPRS